MKTIINLKALLIFLSLAVLLLGSCKAEDKLGSVTQDSQISGGESVSNSLNTSLPIWNVNHSPIPKEYWGKYYYLHTKDNVNGYYNNGRDYNDHTANVTYRTISSYDWKGKVYHTIDVFYKETIYLGNNTWHWNYYSEDGYAPRLSPIFHYIVITKFERNEKGQRVLIENKFIGSDDNRPVNIFVHEDDMNK